MMKTRSILLACMIVAAWGLGCEDDAPNLPPSRSGPRQPPAAIAAKGVARIRADRMFIVPTVALLLKNDAAVPGRMAVTLKSMEPAPDGSRFVFGSIERLASLEELMSSSVDMSSAPMLDPRGNGVFTPTRVYQPKLATLVVLKHNGDEVSGKVSGDFNMFQLDEPRMKPAVVALEVSFTATLVILD